MSELNVYTATDAEIMAADVSTMFAAMPEAAPTEVAEEVPIGAQEEPSELIDESAEEITTEVESEEITDEVVEPESRDQLAELFAPFTANGKEIKVDNIEDARKLMQMGAGFNKKMSALKPHLKLIKMLQNNDLLDESKLNHLIDISKKNPDAIGKLLADSDIDPLNLNASNEYTPNTYSVSDKEIELDNVLGELKDSPHYSKTLDVIVNKWDAASKELLISNPGNIELIHEQVANGIYDQVITVMERERALGRLTGLSDLEAYDRVGNLMHAQGLFAHQAGKPKATAEIKPTAPTADELKLKSRKLAASPTKATTPVKGIADFDPLKMTDAEIMAISLDKFL
jgi:hypothetical protein